MTRKITRDELTELLATGIPVQFVETLRAEHFAAGHLPGAVHIHFEEVEERAGQMALREVLGAPCSARRTARGCRVAVSSSRVVLQMGFSCQQRSQPGWG